LCKGAIGLTQQNEISSGFAFSLGCVGRENSAAMVDIAEQEYKSSTWNPEGQG